MIEKEEEHR